LTTTVDMREKCAKSLFDNSSDKACACLVVSIGSLLPNASIICRSLNFLFISFAEVQIAVCNVPLSHIKC